MVRKDFPCLQCCPQSTVNVKLVHQYFLITFDGLSEKLHYVLESIHTYIYNIFISNAVN